MSLDILSDPVIGGFRPKLYYRGALFVERQLSPGGRWQPLTSSAVQGLETAISEISNQPDIRSCRLRVCP